VDVQINLDDTTTTINNKNAPHLTEEEKVPSKMVVYKVLGKDGKERRMTTREKKDYKCQLALKKKKDKLTTKVPLSRELYENSSSLSTDLLELGHHQLPSTTSKGNNNQRKRQLKQHEQQQQEQIDATAAAAAALEEEEEELAFLERCRVPPVMLSTAMMSIPSITKSFLSLSSSSHKNNSNIEVDDPLAQLWATKIQGQINVAEQLRSQEPIRPMAYTIVPEVWTRMRPVSAMVTQSTKCQTTLYTNADDSRLLSEEDVLAGYTTINVHHTLVEANMCTEAKTYIDTLRDTNHTEDTYNPHDGDTDNRPYYITSMGKFCSNVNDTTVEDDHCIIFNQLYDRNLHISCGAKFGCDFLLYDGPREQRHAFAGLRILTPNTLNSEDQEQSQLPIPSPYDVAGFVRCLNTAGKLALLATVIRSNPVCKYDENDGDTTTCGSRENVVKVVFVELVLEKNLTAPTHQKKSTRKSNSKRKEIGMNLAKKKH
jgi:tRNA splicing endonuclease